MQSITTILILFILIPYSIRIFNCYKLIRHTVHKKECIYFITMENIFKTTNDIHMRYDLKGSKVGRQVLNSELGQEVKSLEKLSFALKDVDLENNKHYFFMGVFIKLF